MKWFIRWLGELFTGPIPKQIDSYLTKYVNGELPNEIDKKTIYIVGEHGYLEHVSMVCPCGCGEVVHLNLLQDERPVWRLQRNKNGTVTLYPSIWREKRCGAHYWIRSGHVHWHKAFNPTT